MTNQEKIDSIKHLIGDTHKDHGRLWKIIEAPNDRSVFAKYMQTRHQKGEAFAKMMYSNYEMDVYAVFIRQQIMSQFEFDRFNEKIANELIRV